MRTFSDNVILQERDVNLHLRNEIIKSQCLTHNQFSSPRFKNLFQYVWFKSGYLETSDGRYWSHLSIMHIDIYFVVMYRYMKYITQKVSILVISIIFLHKSLDVSIGHSVQ